MFLLCAAFVFYRTVREILALRWHATQDFVRNRRPKWRLKTAGLDLSCPILSTLDEEFR